MKKIILISLLMVPLLAMSQSKPQISKSLKMTGSQYSPVLLHPDNIFIVSDTIGRSHSLNIGAFPKIIFQISGVIMKDSTLFTVIFSKSHVKFINDSTFTFKIQN